MKKFYFLIFLFYTTSFAISPKLLTSLEAEIVISGEIEVYGNIKEISTQFYIPQEGIKKIKVFPNNWEIVEDELKNKMIKIKWKSPSSIEKYEVKIIIENKAKFLENLTSEEWFFELAKRETRLTKANDEIRRLAYGNETIFEKTLRLMKWIDENIEYDWSALESSIPMQKSAIEVLKKKKGVSGEMSNFLVAALRSVSIPARVVFGYTLREIKDFVEEKVGHGWAEVFIDGKWIPFDITYFEAGYLDASHIKFANLLENNASEKTTYIGIGNIIVKRNPLKIKVINYTIANLTFDLNVKDKVKGNEAFLVNAKPLGFCRLEKVELISCLDSNAKPLLKILESKRSFWFCNNEDVYFIVIAPFVEKNTIIKCPIILFSEYGVSVKKEIEIFENSPKREEIKISGKDKVSIFEKIKLTSNINGTWFSPNFSFSSFGNMSELYFKKPGKYKIYFYSNGKFGEKEIEVVEEKDFEFVKISVPAFIKFGRDFILNVTIKNVLNLTLPAKVKVEIEDQVKEVYSTFSPFEEKEFSFNLTSKSKGVKKVFISLESRSFNSYTTFVDIVEEKKTFFEKIFEFIKFLFSFKK
ncbi:MAG: transglutaminase domain-containing protein [Candidatus Aenigmarchaeota archaeon]|nr:transglutaminase domain-containing protein [Candidatus Aenigmarchaeota archaeon]MDW8149786.1 transglutaminase domain-containing protein [Candidatus Aenigmarchaeota archaeon]